MAINQHTYQRMDKGVARKKTGPKPSSPRRNNGQFLPVLPNEPKAIKAALEAYNNGATLLQIAKQYGVTRQAIYGWLLGELGGEEHAALVTRSLTARIAHGDEMLDTADNPLDLARGREQARNARLDLERRRSSIYGQQSHVTIEVGDLGDRLRRARERTIDGNATLVDDVQAHNPENAG